VISDLLAETREDASTLLMNHREVFAKPKTTYVSRDMIPCPARYSRAQNDKVSCRSVRFQKWENLW
jgi:hypothetical protein